MYMDFPYSRHCSYHNYFSPSQLHLVSDNLQAPRCSASLVTHSSDVQSFHYYDVISKSSDSRISVWGKNIELRCTSAWTDCICKLGDYFLGGRGHNNSQWTRDASLMRFLDHTQRCTTLSRTPLYEWSVRRRDLYLTTHNIHNRRIS